MINEQRHPNGLRASSNALRSVVVTDCVGFPEPGSIEQEELGADYNVVVVDATTEEEVIAAARLEPEGLLVNMAPITKKVLQSLPTLRAVVRYGVGMDNVDCSEASVLGITALNVPDYCTDEVAQHATSMVMARVRRLAAFDTALRGGAWGPDIVTAPVPVGEETVGLLGFGRIGCRAAQILSSIGFPVIALDPYIPDEPFLLAGVQRVLSLPELASRAHHLSLHVPATEETVGMVDRELLEELGPRGHLVNTARGAIVDEAALLAALDDGAVAWASLDVWRTEPAVGLTARLVAHRHVTATPHIAYLSTKSQGRLRHLAASRLKAALAADRQ